MTPPRPTPPHSGLDAYGTRWNAGFLAALAWTGQAIAELPAEKATGSRDFGRGYAQAIRDVLALLLNEEAP